MAGYIDLYGSIPTADERDVWEGVTFGDDHVDGLTGLDRGAACPEILSGQAAAAESFRNDLGVGGWIDWIDWILFGNATGNH